MTGSIRNQKPKRKIGKWRVFAVVGIFAAVLAVYTVRLAAYEIFGDRSEVAKEYDVKTLEYTVTVPAMRGDICDRNGKIIATTKDAYSLGFEYWSMPADKDAANRTILIALDTVKTLGLEENLTKDYFPFIGTYPSLFFSREAETGDSAVAKKLAYVKKRRALRDDLDAAGIVKWYCKKFALLDAEGNPKYSPEEMTALLRVRYNMDATDFGYTDYILASDVSLDAVTYASEQKPTGMVFRRSTERAYTHPGILSHVLGSVGTITAETADTFEELGYPADATVGLSGIEKLYEEYLHGTDGLRVVVEDDAGNIVDTYIKKEPVDGKDVWLTIDLDLQVVAEETLAEYVKKYSFELTGGGAVVALDAKTGGALVLASYPTYDLSTFSKDYASLLENKATPLLNRALNGVYTPGSTFKPGIAATALEEGIITTSDTVYCSGVYTRFSDYGMRCWVYPGSHGAQNVIEAIIHSCNIFFGEMGYRIGIETMNKYSKGFGLGEPTGIELSESLGTLAGETERIRNGGEWYAGDTVQAAIGQSDNTFTPLQICNYISTLLRGGTRYSVHLLDSVRAYGTGEILLSHQSEVIGGIPLSASTVNTVKLGMKDMAGESATISDYMKHIPVEVGGKTGTAQVGKEHDNGLFVCAAPIMNPDITIAVVIEAADTGRLCAGVASEILGAYYGVSR